MGDSWFFAKFIEVQCCLKFELKVEHSNCAKCSKNIIKLCETPNIKFKMQ